MSKLKQGMRACGNVLSAIDFLHGLVSKELQQKELDYQDLDYELLITVRGMKLQINS